MAQELGSSIADSLNLSTFINDLHGDLRALREGRISMREAHARSELARQILRGVHYVVTAQKFIDAQSKPIGKAGKGQA